MSVLGRVWGAAYMRLLEFDCALKSRRAVKLKCPVLSIGNIAMGGRGKSPAALTFAQKLAEHSLKPILLSRGFGRLSKAEALLLNKDSDLAALRADDYGDEALEFFLKSGFPVVVGRQRAQAFKSFEARLGIDERSVVIADDGFQHWALKRDFDLLLLHRSDLSASIAPFGPLRESPESGIGRADLCVFEGEDYFKETQVVLSPQDFDPERTFGLSTRAPGSSGEQYLRDCGVRNFIRLADHAPTVKVISRLRNLKSGSTLIVGGKEAVKFIGAQRLRQHWAQSEIDKAKAGPIDVEIGPSRLSLKVIIADLNLRFVNEEKVLKVILDSLQRSRESRR